MVESESLVVGTVTPAGSGFQNTTVKVCIEHKLPVCHACGFNVIKVTVVPSPPTSVTVPMPVVREFETGATRDVETGKYDYEGFLSPLAIEAFGAYMHKNRHLRDGSLRDSDNWQKGIPIPVYMKSLWRHVQTLWKAHRGWGGTDEDRIEALCAVIFNAQGYLHELLKAKLK